MKGAGYTMDEVVSAGGPVSATKGGYQHCTVHGDGNKEQQTPRGDGVCNDGLQTNNSCYVKNGIKLACICNWH